MKYPHSLAAPGQGGFALVAAVFTVVFLAQLPGKSALAALVLASRYPTLPVLSGAALALAAHSAIAVSAGGLLSLLPARPVHVGAGLVFVLSAVFMWRSGQKGDDKGAEGKRPESAMGFTRVLGTTLAAVFVAEWGDLTQLATAALAARYDRPLVVFVGATAGLCAATSIDIFIGRGLGHLFRPQLTQRIAAAVFACLGVALVTGIL